MARRFTEKQTARILRRAAELQATAQSPSPSDGLSVEEIERIASEVGLAPDHVRAAASELIAGLEEDPQTRWLGAPPSHEYERIVDGALDDDAWERIVGELNSTFHQATEGTQKGPVRTWHWKHELGSINFTATQSGGSTRLKIVSFVDDGISVGLVVTIGAMIVALGGFSVASGLPPILGVPIGVVVALAIALLFRRLTSAWYRQDRRKLAALMDRLVSLGSSAESPTALAVSATAETADPLLQRLADS